MDSTKTLEQLYLESEYWAAKIAAAKNWGAAMAVADEMRTCIQKEIKAMTITEERGAVYGAFSANADVSQRLKRVLYEADGWKNLSRVEQEGIEMICLKISRAVTGKWHRDNFLDIVGYATLVMHEKARECPE